MTVAELQKAADGRNTSKQLNKLAEEFVGQLAANAHVDPPAGWFMAMEDVVRDAVENTLLGVDISSPHEWEREVDDDAADHEFQRSAGL